MHTRFKKSLSELIRKLSAGHHRYLTFWHWSGVTPYTSSCEFAGSCVFGKQLPGILSLRPHTYFAIVLFLQNDIAISLNILTKTRLQRCVRSEHKNNGKVGRGGVSGGKLLISGLIGYNKKIHILCADTAGGCTHIKTFVLEFAPAGLIFA